MLTVRVDAGLGEKFSAAIQLCPRINLSLIQAPHVFSIVRILLGYSKLVLVIVVA